MLRQACLAYAVAASTAVGKTPRYLRCAWSRAWADRPCGPPHLSSPRSLQELRAATVIVYLTTQAEADGGHTIFPALRAKGGSEGSAEGGWGDGPVGSDEHDGYARAASAARATSPRRRIGSNC